MKKLIIFLLIAAPFVMDAQMTYVPDDHFKQALIKLGYDSGKIKDSVPTKNIDTVKFLDVSGWGIHDLTGIEDFKKIETLDCHDNKIKNLDLKNNFFIKALSLPFNDFDFLDLSNNRNLIILWCYNCKNLRFINIKNGNNKNMYCPDLCLAVSGNPELSCIQVDDSAFSANNKYWQKDPWAHYSTDCGYTGIDVNKFDNNSAAIYPNPASDYIEINLGNHTLKGVVENVKIYNFLEEIVSVLYTPPNPLFLEGEKLRLDVSGLAPGVYFVCVGDIVKKFVKM